MRTSPGKSLPLLITLFFLMFNAASAQLVSTNSRSYSPSDEVASLRRIEQAVLPPAIVFGPPRHQAIENYYREANTDLQERFQEARQIHSEGKVSPYRAMTVVAGSAGIGKTFVKQHVYSDIATDKIWKFDIRELFDDFAKQGIAELKPDLQSGDHVFNRMLSLKPEGRKALVQLLNSTQAAFVVVDSIDEIHPDDYYFVLEQLERLALDTERAFIHVVVFGRPLAFQDFWKDRSAESLPEGLRGFLLNKPDFRTTGDLMVSNWNYDCWKHRLCRDCEGKASPLSIEDYQRWCDSGFSCDGEFADVVFEKNAHITRQARDELQLCCMESRVVTGVLSNLAGNEIVRDIVADQVTRGDYYDERRFMREFLARWLERDTRSDGRPSRTNPEYLDLYMQLLEAVAVKYVAENKIDDLGYFQVASDDRVEVQQAGEKISVAVKDVLNRSGLVSGDPRAPISQRFRFEPFWFHRLLVQLHSERGSRETTNATVRAR